MAAFERKELKREDVLDIWEVDKFQPQHDGRVVLHNGFWINGETGEYVDMADREGGPWEIGDDLGRAEWVLERMGMEEAEISALEARQRMLQRNIDSMIAERKGVLVGLQRRFTEPLRAFAFNRLMQATTVTKTVKTAFGQLSFRTTKGTNEIVDMPAAVAFAQEHCPDAVKLTVNVSDLLAAVDAAGVPTPWLVRSGEKEIFKIDTGIK